MKDEERRAVMVGHTVRILADGGLTNTTTAIMPWTGGAR
jgi:hypothetical protein